MASHRMGGGGDWEAMQERFQSFIWSFKKIKRMTKNIFSSVDACKAEQFRMMAGMTGRGLFQSTSGSGGFLPVCYFEHQAHDEGV